MKKLFIAFAALCATHASAQPVPRARGCTESPASVKSGDLIRLQCGQNITSARMNGRTVKLFRQTDDSYFGLMPVPVLEPAGQYEITFQNTTGDTPEALSVRVRDPHFPTQNVVLSKALTELHATPQEMEMLKAFRENVSDERFWTEPFEAPLTGCLTSPFGVKRMHNGKLTGDYHAGLDQRAAQGTPIHALTAGVIKLAQPFTVSGNTVAIDHGQGLETMYVHMSQIAVTPGAHVQKGDVIGYVGSTGRSTGPHLHWTIYANGIPTNPSQWFAFKSCSPKSKRSRSTKGR